MQADRPNGNREMKRLTCTVIIPTFNRAGYIADAIDSILGQTRAPDQVIVVDDGSTDDTLAVLEAYSGRIEVVSKPNGGKSTAINRAVPLARGDCVWIFDDDDVALPDALHRHLAALEENPEAGFTYSAVQVGHSGPDGGIVVQYEARLWPAEPDEFLIRMMEHCFVYGQPAVVARKECLVRVGLFDERLVRCQDYDIMLKLARHYPPARIEEPTFIQRRHPGARGTLAQSFSGADPSVAWSRYNRIFISELLDTLPLDRYVPKSWAYSERTARIQRFAIATRHVVPDSAGRDLAWIVANGGDLTAAERRILIGALTHFTALREIGTDECRRLARACKGRIGRQVRVSLAKGLVYETVAAFRRRRFSEVRSLMPRIVALVGMAGAAELLREKLGRTPRRLSPSP